MTHKGWRLPQGGLRPRRARGASGSGTASPRCSSRRPSSSLPWIVYPTIRTIIRSFYDREGDTFVGVDNYETLFTDDTLLIAIRNNFLWILVVPALVTAIGLVFAVLLERIRFSTAFKVAVFMPMAISLFAAGVIWRLMYEKDLDQGRSTPRYRSSRTPFRRPGCSPTRDRRPTRCKADRREGSNSRRRSSPATRNPA